MQTLSGSNTSTLPGYLDLSNICLFLILILSLVSFFIYVKKYSRIKAALKVDINFMKRIRDYIHDGKIEAATSLCKSMESPAGRLIEKGIGRIGTSVNDVCCAMECLSKIEGYKIGKGIQVLLSIAATVIVLGISGSMFALIYLIKVPHKLTLSSIIAGSSGCFIGIEGGLLAALLIYLAFRRLKALLANFNYSMLQITVDFIDLLNEPIK